MSGEDSSSSTELCPGILHPMIGSAQENGPMCNGTANGMFIPQCHSLYIGVIFQL